jgi:dihydroneopterin aldolase
VDKKEAKTVAYEEVSEKLKDNIRMQKFEMSLEKLTSDLKQNAKITYPKK